MPMTEMRVGDQIIRYDREATAAIYASLRHGWAEDCGCVGCRNLLAQRDLIYPASFRELLHRLGIDPNKEAEAVADGPLENGWHHYGGWFFFVGEMVTPGERLCEASDSPSFKYHFTQVGPCPKAFRAGPKLCIEFEAHIKWILDESWDSDRRILPAAPNDHRDY
jgi:hypothetical protein